MTTDKADRATFQITDATAEQVDVSCLQLDWHFSFCAITGAMLSGQENAQNLERMGYDLAEWALRTAQEHAQADFMVMQPCRYCACSACDCAAQMAEVMEEQALLEDDVPFYDWAQA